MSFQTTRGSDESLSYKVFELNVILAPNGHEDQMYALYFHSHLEQPVHDDRRHGSTIRGEGVFEINSQFLRR